MEFVEQLHQFSQRIETLKYNVQTEEATKTSLVMPFFSLLGYDVFNPNEFIPEFTADVGIKKGEKVDYAIVINDLPTVLVEVKHISEKLHKHGSQLFRYFGTTKAKFGILTNGHIYKFFTDLNEPNKMDEKPFMEIDILDIKESQIQELKKFHKSTFNVNEILDIASELKYSNEFKNYFKNELQNPSDDLVKLFLTGVYDGVKTQGVIERFKPIVKKSLNSYISETMSDKLKSAFNENVPINVENIVPTEIPKTSKIITTDEELEAYFIIKNILRDIVDINDITYKDTESYISICYKSKVTKWICRLLLSKNRKILILPDDNKKDLKFPIENIYDIENHADELKNILNRYIN